MIKNIIFDFGDIFIDLDKTATPNAFFELGLQASPNDTNALNENYEIGKVSTSFFISLYKKWLPNATEFEIVDAWNSILKSFPRKRLDFLQELAKSKKYRLFLLSNTNDLHIESVKENTSFFEEFKNCFEKFYLSQEIGLRKPNTEIYEFVLSENNLKAEETLFVDDLKTNTDAAATLGIHTWNLIPKQQDVTQLFTLKTELF